MNRAVAALLLIIAVSTANLPLAIVATLGGLAILSRR